MKYIVCDLDNTLANCQHRVHLAQTKQWDKFNSLCHLDVPNEDVLAFVKMACSSFNIAIVTGRNEYYREATIAWLAKFEIKVDIILMRPIGDRTHTGELKVRMLEEFFGFRKAVLDSVLFAIDDRNSDTKALREYGLRVWQTMDGAY